MATEDNAIRWPNPTVIRSQAAVNATISRDSFRNARDRRRTLQTSGGPPRVGSDDWRKTARNSQGGNEGQILVCHPRAASHRLCRSLLPDRYEADSASSKRSG